MLLALCAGNSLANGEFLAQRPVTQSFDVFFDLGGNKRMSKQSWGWWFETPSCSLWRHCNVWALVSWDIWNILIAEIYVFWKFHIYTQQPYLPGKNELMKNCMAVRNSGQPGVAGKVFIQFSYLSHMFIPDIRNTSFDEKHMRSLPLQYSIMWYITYHYGT